MAQGHPTSAAHVWSHFVEPISIGLAVDLTPFQSLGHSGPLRAGLILGHGLGGACMGAWDVFGLSDSRPRELL